MLRILSHTVADGPVQMAWDEALLDIPGPMTFRTYGWSRPTLSLGYFQAYAPIISQMPPGLPVVRRITGGGAIWHEHEVTYALVGTLGQDGLPAQVRACYPLLHGAVLTALRRRGTPALRQPSSIGDRRYRDEPRCFASPAADDLVAAAGGKMLGSAGRVRNGRILIHGSLKLASNPWDGEAVSGCGLDADEARSLLREAFVTALAAEPVPESPSPLELAAHDRILAQRYGTTTWVEHRLGPPA